MEHSIEVIDLRTGKLAEPLGLVPDVFTVRPGYRLFSVGSVLAATLVGTPAAGAALLAVNCWRLERGGRAWVLLIMGLVAEAMTAVAGRWILWRSFSWHMGAWVVVAMLELVWLAGMQIVAVGLQAQAVERHVARGGKLERAWVALLVGILFLAGTAVSAMTKSRTGVRVVSEVMGESVSVKTRAGA
jgi:hypothetical protein